MSPRRLVLSDIEAIGARIKDAPTPDARESLIELLFADLRNDIAEGICPTSGSTARRRVRRPGVISSSRRQSPITSNNRVHPSPFAFFNASHAALCTARHGVRSHPVPVALVGGSLTT
jgi:hypothetical protein